MSVSKTMFDAIVPAGGRGVRMGSSINKLYLKINGVPILYRTLFRLNHCPLVRRIIVAVGERDHALFDEMMKKYGNLPKISALVSGGEERCDSVRNGLEHSLKWLKSDLILVHDGARPFFSDSLIVDLAEEALKRRGAVIPALKIVETVRRQKNQTSRTVDRESLFLSQTPQAFHVKHVYPCFFSEKRKNLNLTDEASYFEEAGLPVSMVKGEKWNIKITEKEDLAWAECLLNFHPWLRIPNYDE